MVKSTVPATRKLEEEEFEEGRQYYQRNRSRFASRYKGQYVAVVGGEIVDSDVDFSKLADRVYRRYGYRDIFMPKVEEQGMSAEVRSPQLRPVQTPGRTAL